MLEEKSCPFMSGVVVGQAQGMDRKGLVAPSAPQPIIISGNCMRARCAFWDHKVHECKINIALDCIIVAAPINPHASKETPNAPEA